jgi:16S rRNA (uracil1498-N3)-methyltransferase
MPRYDFHSPRLYVAAALVSGHTLVLDPPQGNYLRNVLRLRTGAPVLVFNGRDGEWHATLADHGKRALSLAIGKQARAQTTPLDLQYLFAPLKHARLDYMVQKAVEMGASGLQPVLTRHTQVARVNLERMKANAIEAAEQCGILTLPEIASPVSLEQMLAERKPERLLIFCDEDVEVKDPLEALATVRPAAGSAPPPLAVLIGPEGGFADDERASLLRAPNLVRLALGPRILRADTAAVAALALVGAALGDWR